MTSNDFELEISDNRPPDLCFSSELDGVKYDVEAWSINDKIILVLPRFGRFTQLVKAIIPGLDSEKLPVVVQEETCKCVKEAGRLLSGMCESRVLNES